jgi:hypothetical protein
MMLKGKLNVRGEQIKEELRIFNINLYLVINKDVSCTPKQCNNLQNISDFSLSYEDSDMAQYRDRVSLR